MYRTIDARFWNDPMVKALPHDGKLLFLYLITNMHSHLSGLYYLPIVTIAHEIGLGKPRLDTLFDTLSSAGLAKFDKENSVIWVVNMFRYQGLGEKNHRATVNNFKNLHNSRLIKAFIEKYPIVKPYLPDRVSIPHPAQDSFGTQEQEQEQEQEQDPPKPPKGGAEGFDEFWNLYPKKVAKPAALKAWNRLAPPAELREQIAAALEKQTRLPDWNKEGGRFIPHPATWLNQGRWADVLTNGRHQETTDERIARLQREMAEEKAAFLEKVQREKESAR